MATLSRIVEQLAITPASWRRARHNELLASIDAREPQVRQLDASELRKASLALRYRAKSGEPTGRLLAECFALVREAARRTIGLRHYAVQLLAGMAMHQRSVVQMQTGEGKTLTATLPLGLFALAGRGAYLGTANDYLARRDADWMRPVYEAIGLTVGVVEAKMPPTERTSAYQCDITYGTAKEFGFDFLRDRLQERQRLDGQHDWLGAMLGDEAAGTGALQRPPHFMLVDEADSILIDEARTPLIISSVPDDDLEQTLALYRWSALLARQLEEDKNFTTGDDGKTISLTPAGRRRVRTTGREEILLGCDMVELYEHVERAVGVLRNFHRDRQYVIRDNEVVIVDEFTGRLAEGRRWRDGIHQAIEAKERLNISPPTAQAARVTVQEFFARFPHVAGMTGTIASSGSELKKIYKLNTTEIPTNRPPRREQLPTAVFGHADAKWAAVVQEISATHGLGRPVLVGTRSIDKSEHLSQMLTDAGIAHQVLNARHVEAEAEIVAVAGHRGKVTIATNMAGRGTDVKLGPSVEELGGLHVICTELHDSARIDRQLIGRCGRQGDPGSYRQFLALDDEILRLGLGEETAATYARRGRDDDARYDQLAPLFAKAQAIVERQHYRQRTMMMHYQQQRKESQVRMGLDPYLDAPG